MITREPNLNFVKTKCQRDLFDATKFYSIFGSLRGRLRKLALILELHISAKSGFGYYGTSGVVENFSENET